MTHLYNRLIPCLLMQDGGLIKTRKFADPKYVGDPINAVRIFNEKAVDELILLDIDVSKTGAEPNYDLISWVAGECFMPLCYGGGIRTIDQARRIIACGVEKLAINSSAIRNLDLIHDLSQELGASSVVGALDVKLDAQGRPKVYDASHGRLSDIDPVAHAEALVSAGAGEIFLNSVDRDGTYEGYDTALISSVTGAVNVPVVACGGAGNLQHLRPAIAAGASAVAAGSIFVFYGPHRAVLINYPEYDVMRDLLEA